MKTKSVLAALAAAAPLALLAQAQGPVPADPNTAAPAKVAPQKAYVPHKTPLARKGAPKKGPAAPKKPAPPEPPAAPKKPIDVPWVLHDKQGNPIPTNPDAYDVGPAKKK